jgi:hypothetical protein
MIRVCAVDRGIHIASCHIGAMQDNSVRMVNQGHQNGFVSNLLAAKPRKSALENADDLSYFLTVGSDMCIAEVSNQLSPMVDRAIVRSSEGPTMTMALTAAFSNCWEKCACNRCCCSCSCCWWLWVCRVVRSPQHVPLAAALECQGGTLEGSRHSSVFAAGQLPIAPPVVAPVKEGGKPLQGSCWGHCSTNPLGEKSTADLE